MSGSALAVAVAVAAVTALNFALAPDAAERSLDRAVASVERAGRFVADEVTRRVAGDRDMQEDADRDAADDERATGHTDRTKRWPPCRARMHWHEHSRMRLCGTKIRCETHEMHGQTHVICGSAS
jgi:hypothetical protein